MNVLILRIPKGESILTSSACTSCKTPIKSYHNIPVVSFLLLRGECSHCSSPISKQYPIVEALSGLIALLLYWKFGLTAETLLLIFLFTLLLALSLIDLRYRAVPDSINLTALTVAIIAPFSADGIVVALENSLIFAGAFSFLRFYTSFFVGREAMGEGDIMVAGVIGAVLGVYLGTFAIFLSALLSLPPHLIWRGSELPFIPFLATALFLTLLFQSEVIELLNSIYGF
jgi:leader peptidase (prepilin peptidase)/N-methyltransferase